MTEDQMVNIIIWGEVLFISLVPIWIYWDHKRIVKRQKKELLEMCSDKKIMNNLLKLNLFYGYGGRYGVENEDDPDQIS